MNIKAKNLQYLKEMDMENLNSNLPREEQIEIILSHAIRLEFTDNGDKLIFILKILLTVILPS